MRFSLLAGMAAILILMSLALVADRRVCARRMLLVRHHIASFGHLPGQ